MGQISIHGERAALRQKTKLTKFNIFSNLKVPLCWIQQVRYLLIINLQVKRQFINQKKQVNKTNACIIQVASIHLPPEKNSSNDKSIACLNA